MIGKIFMHHGWNTRRLPTVTMTRRHVVWLILLVSLAAFELFNFDTTRYALGSLLGNTAFGGFSWAAILALAFCSIDFAGLTHLFSLRDEPQKRTDRETWYLTAAWLLGATMNAVMTWWAVSLTLLEHPLGNELLSREELLRFVPIFVAMLVWLTRILFIGAVSVSAEQRTISEMNRNKETVIARQPVRQQIVSTKRPLTHSPAVKMAPIVAQQAAKMRPLVGRQIVKRGRRSTNPQRNIAQRVERAGVQRPLS